MCEECEDNGYIEEDCSACNGSGEGMYDGSICRTCGGHGIVLVDCDCDADEN